MLPHIVILSETKNLSLSEAGSKRFMADTQDGRENLASPELRRRREGLLIYLFIIASMSSTVLGMLPDRS